MPTLDVSELLTDPTFVQTITVIRQREVVGEDGRTTKEYETIPDVVASVQPKDTAIGGNSLSRESDSEYRGAALDVFTKFRLRSVSREGAEEQYQPDIVVYKHDHYLVVLLNDFSDYGDGYIHAECSSVESIDEAPV